MQRRYGWKKDKSDKSLIFEAPHIRVFPEKLSWRSHLPECYDQGATSSCTGQGVAAAVFFDRIRDGKPPFTPSRKFIYWNGRAIEGSTSDDAGARIQDVVDALGDRGYCTELSCPFEDMTESPTLDAFHEGLQNLVTSRHRVAQGEHAIKAALMAGRVVICGMLVYASMEGEEAANSGRVPLPQDSEEFFGGHCVVITGWDDKRRLWEVRNSWGPAWGDHGYFWTDRAYFLNPQLSSDFTIVF